VCAAHETGIHVRTSLASQEFLLLHRPQIECGLRGALLLLAPDERVPTFRRYVCGKNLRPRHGLSIGSRRLGAKRAAPLRQPL